MTDCALDGNRAFTRFTDFNLAVTYGCNRQIKDFCISNQASRFSEDVNYFIVLNFRHAEFARIGNTKRLDVKTRFINLLLFASLSSGGWAVAGL
jgi:hypothetical protein